MSEERKKIYENLKGDISGLSKKLQGLLLEGIENGSILEENLIESLDNTEGSIKILEKFYNLCDKLKIKVIAIEEELGEKKIDKAGYLYILTNPLHKDYVYIGICTGSIDDIIKKKSEDILLPYDKFASLKTKKYKEAKKLLLYCIRNNECLNNFVKVNLKEIREILSNIKLLLDDAILEGSGKNISNIIEGIEHEKPMNSNKERKYKERVIIDEATPSQKDYAKNILESLGLKNKQILLGITEAILANGGEANITKVIIPYIKKYYPNLYERYKNNDRNFNAWINTTIRELDSLFVQIDRGTFGIIGRFNE